MTLTEAATTLMAGKCSNGHTVKATLSDITNAARTIPCPCGKLATMSFMTVAYNPDTECTARCTGARGNDCECSCIGANHGSDRRFVA